MDSRIVVVSNHILQETLKYNNTTVLFYKIEYPQFSTAVPGISLLRINSYYSQKAIDFQTYCRTEFFNMAVENYKLEVEFGLPLVYFRASLSYSMAFNDSCVLSLYFDRYEFAGGAHGITSRNSQTWNIQNSNLFALHQFYGCSGNYRTYLAGQILEQANKTPELYFQDFTALIADKFNPENFYCKPEGLVLYYQIYDIAPFVGGIVEFLLPYAGCVKTPTSFCTL